MLNSKVVLIKQYEHFPTKTRVFLSVSVFMISKPLQRIGCAEDYTVSTNFIKLSQEQIRNVGKKKDSAMELLNSEVVKFKALADRDAEQIRSLESTLGQYKESVSTRNTYQNYCVNILLY